MSLNVEVGFAADMGVSFWKNFFKVACYWMIFFTIIIVFAEAKMIDFSLIATILEFSIALLVAIVLSAFGEYSDVSQIVFNADGIYLRSAMFLHYGYGRNKYIPYSKCAYKEKSYWRIVRINNLIVYEGKRPSFRIDDQTWSESYSKIQAEFKIHLG